MNIRNTAIAILAFGGIAMGGSPAHAAPDDHVTGSGIMDLVEGGGSARVSVAARVDPDADQSTATGQVQIRLDSGESAQGTVTCLRVKGQLAIIGGTLDQPIDGNGFFIVGIFDGGLGGEPDLGGLELLPGGSGCKSATIDSEVRSGNYTIKNW